MIISSPFPSAFPGVYQSFRWQRIRLAAIASASVCATMELLPLQKLQDKPACFECTIEVFSANPDVTTNSVPIARAHLEPTAVVKRP